MNIKPNAVTSAVRHAAPRVRRIRWRHTTGKSVGMNHAKCGAMHVLAGDAGAYSRNRCTLRLQDGAVHACDLWVHFAMHHRACAIAVVERLLAARKDVHDHRLAGS